MIKSVQYIFFNLKLSITFSNLINEGILNVILTYKRTLQSLILKFNLIKLQEEDRFMSRPKPT